MTESHFLSAQERVEWFEQAIQGLLEDRCKETLKPDHCWYGRVATVLANVWSANSVYIWATSPANSQEMRRFGSDASISDLQLDASDARLLELARERKGILWIEPSKATRHWRAITRVAEDVPLVIELVYHASDDNLPIGRDAILFGLEHNITMLARYGNSLWCAQDKLASLSSHVDNLAIMVLQQRRALCGQISEQLRRLEGKKLATFDENRALAASIQRLLEENGLRLQCPTCGEPAIMRCLKAGNSPTGSFVFDHRMDGRRTMHGGRVEVPSLIVVDKAARKSTEDSLKASIRVVKAVIPSQDASTQMS